MTHRKLALPLVAAAALVGLSACSSSNAGTPTPSSSTPPSASASSPTSSSDPLTSVDPCSLITSAEESNSQLQPGTTDPNAPGGRACRWERPDDGATIDGYVLEVVIYDTTGISQFNSAGGTLTDYSVGKYQGKLFQEPVADACRVTLPTSNTSRIDIQVISRLGLTQSCKLVQQVAPAVVSHFPAGS